MEWQYEICRFLSENNSNRYIYIYIFLFLLNVLGIVIKAYSKQKHLLQKHLFKKTLKLGKNSESLWYLSHGPAPFLPLAPSFSLQFLPRMSRLLAFLMLPAPTSPYVTVPKRSGPSFLYPAPTYSTERPCQEWQTKNTVF